MTERRVRRQLKRIVGDEAADEFTITAERSRRAASILRRGFWGRWKWLLFGR